MKSLDESDCTVKQRHTTHWDLDYLSQEEVEALMQAPRENVPGSAARKPATHDNSMPQIENPLRLGLLLFAGAVLLMGLGVLLLRA